jgi:hypothetical protein
MAEVQGRARVTLARSLGVALGLAAGGALAALVLLASGHPAAAADLPASAPIAKVAVLPDDATAATQGVIAAARPEVPTTTVATPTAVVGAVVASTAAGPLQSGLPAAVPSGGTVGPVVGTPALSVPALPVRSTAAPLAPVGVVRQGAPATPNVSRPPLSATALGVADRTGSAALLAPVSASAAQGRGTEVPSVPAPGAPWRPFLLPLLTTFGAAASAGAHAGPLDTFPPTILVLALLVGALVGPWRERRLRSRLTPVFSPPG